MLWFIYALICAVSGGVANIIMRYIAKDYDFVSLGFVLNMLCALMFIPLMLPNFYLPQEAYAYQLVFFGVLIWTGVSLLNLKSSQLVEVSLKDPLSQTQLIFTLILTSVFLGEVLTTNKILGTFLIFFGLIVLTYKRKALGRFREPGVNLVLLMSFLWSLVGLIDKTALNYWPVPTYSFMVFLFPSLIMGAVTTRRVDKLVRMVKDRFWYIVAGSLSIVTTAYTGFVAIKLTDISNAVPVFKLSALVSVLGGVLLLKEEKEIWKKAVGAVIMILGAVLIYSGA